MRKLIFVFVFLLLAGCSDHSRNLTINNAAEEDSCIELSIESLFEKTGNREESTPTADISPELSIPATAL